MPSIHYPAEGTLKKPENILWLSDRLNIRQSVWKPFLHVITQNWERLVDFKSEHTCCSKITCFSIPHITYGNLGKRCLADVQVNFLWAWSRTKLNLISNLLSKIKWQFIPADCFWEDRDFTLFCMTIDFRDTLQPKPQSASLPFSACSLDLAVPSQRRENELQVPLMVSWLAQRHSCITVHITNFSDIQRCESNHSHCSNDCSSRQFYKNENAHVFVWFFASQSCQ